MDPIECPCCPGNGGVLGALGNRVHFSCRDCGAQWSMTADELGDEFMGYVNGDPEDNLSDAEADSMTLASAGYGMDEDYGCFAEANDGEGYFEGRDYE